MYKSYMNWQSRTKEFYDKHAYEKPLESFYPGRLRKRNILKILKKQSFQNTLNLGCGTGRYTNIIKEFSQKTVGCDFSINRLKKVGLPACMADCERLPFKDNSFDFILSIELLQHVRPEGIKKTIEEIKRVLDMHGKIVFIFKNGENPFKSEPENPIIWFSRKDLKKIFKDFEIKFVGDRILPDKLTIFMIKPISFTFEIIDSFISKRFIKFSDSIILIGEKK